MKYSKFERFDKPFPIFGMGTMRLPEIEADGRKRIDTDTAVKMIRYAIDNGAYYIDTAKPYHNGDSEKVVGMALKDGYRDRACLVTKLTPWQVNRQEDMEKIFNEQIKSLQTEYVDIYLLHYLTKGNWEKFLRLNVFDFLHKIKQQGRIKHIGFSFHDEYSLFKEIIDYYDWDICQVQMNIMDAEKQATVKGIRYAGEKGIPVAIMEPLKGGRLVKNIPEEVLEVWKRGGEEKTPAAWAFKWLCNFPEVAVILSGVSDMEQLRQNINIFESLEHEKMSAAEQKLIDEVVKAYRKNIKVECTGCGYCAPCPNSVDIPLVFQIYNEASILKDYKQSLMEYWSLVLAKGAGGNGCTQCGSCSVRCPQKIDIPSLLKEAHDFIMNQGNTAGN